MNLINDFDYLNLEPRIKRELELSQMSQSLEPILIAGEAGLEKILVAKHIHSLNDKNSSPFTAFRCLQKNSKYLHEIPFQKLEYSTLFFDHAEFLTHEEQTFLVHKMKQHQFKLILSTLSQFKKNFHENLLSNYWTFPSLRERKTDILSIANQVGHHFFNWNGKEFLGFDLDAKSALEDYSWPGNTLELSLCIQKISLLHPSNTIIHQSHLDLPAKMIRLKQNQTPQASSLHVVSSNVSPISKIHQIPQSNLAEEGLSFTDLKKKWSDAFEKDYLTQVLLKNQGNVSAAARESKIDRSNFLRLLRRHGIKSDEYRKEVKDVKQAA